MKITSGLISIALASFLIGCGGGSSDNNTPKKDENKPTIPTPKPTPTPGSSVIIKGENQINANLSGVGKTKLSFKRAETLNYNNDVEEFATKHNSEDGKDNYIRDFATNGDKLAVASVYHNALVVFDTKNGKYGFSPFGALEGAGHGELGTSVDGSTQASETWLNQVAFDESGEYVYLNLKPKYLGRNATDKQPDLASAGLYKAKLSANLTTTREDAVYHKGQYFQFGVIREGQFKGNLIALNDEGKLEILKENLDTFITVPTPFTGAKSFEIRNDKVFVFIDATKDSAASVQELSMTAHKITNVYPIKKYDGDIFMNVTNDGSKIVYYVTNSDNAKVCTIETATKNEKCADLNTGFRRSGTSSISADNKLLSISTGGGALDIVNIENEPLLVAQIPAGSRSYATAFLNNSKVVFSSDRRNIEVYDLSQGNAITLDGIFNSAKDKLFDINSEDMNNIQVAKYTRHGQERIYGDIDFPTFIDGVNVSYELSREFSEYINNKGEFIKVPTGKVSGTITATLTLLKDGKVVKEDKKTSPMAILPKPEK